MRCCVGFSSWKLMTMDEECVVLDDEAPDAILTEFRGSSSLLFAFHFTFTSSRQMCISNARSIAVNLSIADFVDR
jgi:hypothetical protein